MTGSQTRAKVLVLDCDRDRAAELSRRVKFLDYEPIIVPSAADFTPDAAGIAVVIGDTDSSERLTKAAKDLRRSRPNMPFLCLTGVAKTAVGPNWTLELPLKRSQLARLLRRAKRYRGRERRHRLTGTSHPIRKVRQLIEQVADFDTNVLVMGESGTGKELVARTIHELSARAEQPFVPVNCGAIPAELLESELFGHEKGAFTDAVHTRKGRFELAQGGTLFLDEIGEMSLDMQVKLLRVLQERTFERLGCNNAQNCDVRIVAATHVDLPAAVSRGDFREDLYYRLNVFPIEMPPLYKRASDIPQLLDELLIAKAGQSKGSLRMSQAAIAVLARYRWPGNVRELSNLVERLAILKPDGVVSVDDLPAKYQSVNSLPCSETINITDVMQLTEANLKQHLQSLEQDLIVQAMAAAGGVVAKAARMLSMRRTTLVEKIGKYQIA